MHTVINRQSWEKCFTHIISFWDWVFFQLTCVWWLQWADSEVRTGPWNLGPPWCFLDFPVLSRNFCLSSSVCAWQGRTEHTAGSWRLTDLNFSPQTALLSRSPNSCDFTDFHVFWSRIVDTLSSLPSLKRNIGQMVKSTLLSPLGLL